MLSFGILASRAVSIARRRRGLPSGSPPPRRAAIVISLISLVKTLLRFASFAPFLCLICDHLLWPAIVFPFGSRASPLHRAEGGVTERPSHSRAALTRA